MCHWNSKVSLAGGGGIRMHVCLDTMSEGQQQKELGVLNPGKGRLGWRVSVF